MKRIIFLLVALCASTTAVAAPPKPTQAEGDVTLELVRRSCDARCMRVAYGIETRPAVPAWRSDRAQKPTSTAGAR